MSSLNCRFNGMERRRWWGICGLMDDYRDEYGSHKKGGNEEDTMEKPWYQKGKFHVGSLNYHHDLIHTYDFPAEKRVKMVDSTIRKLESTPGVRLTIQDKVEIAMRSEQLGMAEIYINNIHFVPEYFESTKAITQQKDKLVVNVQTWLTEGWKEGIKKSLEAKADQSEVEARTSDVELLRLGLTKAGMIQRMCDAIDYGKDLGADMTAGFMDSTRAEFSFLIDIINQSLEHGASKLVFYDSFGSLSPDAIRFFITQIRKNLIHPVPMVMHVHNMFGLGTAGALAAITAGATHVDVAANGLPSNCALAPLEETVIAIEMLLGLKTGVSLEKIYDYCKLIEQKSGIMNAPYKAVVGDHVFLYESDNEVAEYFRGSKIENLKPFSPGVVGRKAKVVWDINTLRGDSVRAKLESMGLRYGEEEVHRILENLKTRLNQKPGFPVWLTESEVEKICLEIVKK